MEYSITARYAMYNTCIEDVYIMLPNQNDSIILII